MMLNFRNLLVIIFLNVVDVFVLGIVLMFVFVLVGIGFIVWWKF